MISTPESTKEKWQPNTPSATLGNEPDTLKFLISVLPSRLRHIYLNILIFHTPEKTPCARQKNIPRPRMMKFPNAYLPADPSAWEMSACPFAGIHTNEYEKDKKRDRVGLQMQRGISTESREVAASAACRSSGQPPVKCLISGVPSEPGFHSVLAERVALLLWAPGRTPAPS